MPPFWFLFVRQCQYNSKYLLYFKRKCKKSIFTNFEIVKCIGTKFDELISLRRDIFLTSYMQWKPAVNVNCIIQFFNVTSHWYARWIWSLYMCKIGSPEQQADPLSAVRGQRPLLFKYCRASNFSCQSYVLYRNTLGSLLCCIIRGVAFKIHVQIGCNINILGVR